jgi:RND family efflux transporter MFP subunit
MPAFTPKPVVLIVIAVGVIAAGGLAWQMSSAPAPEKGAAKPAAGPSAPVAARPALTVTTTQARLGALPIKLGANGNIAAWQEASVGTESNGLRLAEVLVNVGDVVSRGQLLARFADDSVQADVAQARAGVAETAAQATEATANANRVRTLQGTGTFSGQQISQYLAAEQTALARVESAKAALAAQTLRLKNTQVLAPDAGIISARSATVGAVVSSGTELFRMIRQGRLEWRAEVTATELGRMLPGTGVTVTAANGAQLKGRVRTVAPTVDPLTRSGLVYVDLPPMQISSAAREATSVGATAAAPGRPKQGTAPSGLSAAAPDVPAHIGTARRDVASGVGMSSAVREATSVGAIPGMFARGEFELGESKALTVPQQAVVVRDGFSYVFRLNPDQRVSQIKVQPGRRVGERVEVLDGIGPDAVLVASGAGFLNDGDLVKVVVAPAAPVPAATDPATPPATAAQPAPAASK